MNYTDYYRKELKELKELACEPLVPAHGLFSVKQLPASIRQYYELAGNHPINREHNVIFRPDELYEKDGRLVFGEENQQVVIWGIRLEGIEQDDPIVYQGQEYDGVVHWYSEEQTFSEFIIAMFKWQAGLEGQGHG